MKRRWNAAEPGAASISWAAAIVGWAAEARLATAFLTIIPVGRDSATAAELTGSLGWFPLIGFILGAFLAGADYLLAFFVAVNS